MINNNNRKCFFKLLRTKLDHFPDYSEKLLQRNRFLAQFYILSVRTENIKQVGVTFL